MHRVQSHGGAMLGCSWESTASGVQSLEVVRLEDRKTLWQCQVRPLCLVCWVYLGVLSVLTTVLTVFGCA